VCVRACVCGKIHIKSNETVRRMFAIREDTSLRFLGLLEKKLQRIQRKVSFLGEKGPLVN